MSCLGRGCSWRLLGRGQRLGTHPLHRVAPTTQSDLASDVTRAEVGKSRLIPLCAKKYSQLPPGRVHLAVPQGLKLNIFQKELIVCTPPPILPVGLPSSIFHLWKSGSTHITIPAGTGIICAHHTHTKFGNTPPTPPKCQLRILLALPSPPPCSGHHVLSTTPVTASLLAFVPAASPATPSSPSPKQWAERSF